MADVTTESKISEDDFEYYVNDQVIVVGYVHNIHEPKSQTVSEESSEKNTIKSNGKKKFANFYLQCSNNYHFARIFGTLNDITNQPLFRKVQEAEKSKKAIKLIARKGKDLGQ